MNSRSLAFSRWCENSAARQSKQRVLSSIPRSHFADISNNLSASISHSTHINKISKHSTHINKSSKMDYGFHRHFFHHLNLQKCILRKKSFSTSRLLLFPPSYFFSKKKNPDFDRKRRVQEILRFYMHSRENFYNFPI